MKENFFLTITHNYNQPICIIGCQGKRGILKERFEYAGPEDCWFNYLLLGGSKGCLYACLGYGNCAKVCPTGAILMENQFPVIDSKKCNGCGRCIPECPTGVLKLIPNSQLIHPACSSTSNKAKIKEVCKMACDGCGICVQFCPYGAIKIEDNLPQIDFEKCPSCGICVHKCPQGVLIDRARARPYAIISLKCNGCGDCIKVCSFDAISGETEKRHIVDREKCIGCGRCFEVCKFEAITMAGALGYVDAA